VLAAAAAVLVVIVVVAITAVVVVVVNDLVINIFFLKKWCVYAAAEDLVLARSVAALNPVWARKLSVILFLSATA
jgi:hypothetical protein